MEGEAQVEISLNYLSFYVYMILGHPTSNKSWLFEQYINCVII